MFGRIKNKRKKSNKANAKLAKKLLGQDYGRRVFGFPCSPDIKYRLKMLAGELDIPLYGLCEHCLQLAAWLIAKIKENSEETDMLIKHIKEVHMGAREIEKISKYDQDMAEMLDEERRRRFEIDKATHQIVITYFRAGLKPKDVLWAVDYAIRCRVAVARGEPIPQDWPPKD